MMGSPRFLPGMNQNRFNPYLICIKRKNLFSSNLLKSAINQINSNNSTKEQFLVSVAFGFRLKLKLLWFRRNRNRNQGFVLDDKLANHRQCETQDCQN